MPDDYSHLPLLQLWIIYYFEDEQFTYRWQRDLIWLFLLILGLILGYNLHR
jgi:hypothetical protein